MKWYRVNFHMKKVPHINGRVISLQKDEARNLASSFCSEISGSLSSGTEILILTWDISN